MKRRSQVASEWDDDTSEEEAIKIPHDPFNEQVLIATAITLPPRDRAQLVAKVRPDQFLEEAHSAIWAGLRELVQRELDYDHATVAQLSGEKVSAQYLSELVRRNPTPTPNVQHHIRVLEWDHSRGEAVRGPLARLVRALRNPRSEPQLVQSVARQLGAAFDGHQDQRYLRDPGLLVREREAELERRRENQACYPFGIDGLDKYEDGRWRLVPGGAPGKVTVVTAVPGSGKSTLVANMALGFARQKRRVAYGAWEMGAGETLELLALISLGWSRYSFSVGDYTAEEQAALLQRMDRIREWVRFWDLPVGRERGTRYSNERSLDSIHGFMADSGCDVAIFDLWKRALVNDEPSEEERALYRQQAIAAETQMHCVLVQQQRSKDIEQRPDKRPTREGIKGSSAWVEVADTIFGVHNPALWKNVSADVIEVDILKQRYAKWPLAVEFDWDPDRGRIGNGRSVDYDPPGTPSGGNAELNTFLSGKKGKSKGGKRNDDSK